MKNAIDFTQPETLSEAELAQVSGGAASESAQAAIVRAILEAVEQLRNRKSAPATGPVLKPFTYPNDPRSIVFPE